MADTYTINGKKYTVEVKGDRTSTTQTLVINGQEIKLAPAKDRNGKSSMNMQIPMPNKEEYNGPYMDEIYAVMAERKARGVANRAEELAVYQQDYNNMLKAEFLARGESELDAEQQKLTLTAKQLEGKEALPDLKKRFPWAYVGKMSVAKDTAAQLWDKEARFRMECRRQLIEVKKDTMFDDMRRIGNKNVIVDQLALQRKASDARGKIGGEIVLDKDTERLIAAAEKKKTKSKAAPKRTKQTEMPDMSASYDRA
jgi:hypothetical protein